MGVPGLRCSAKVGGARQGEGISPCLVVSFSSSSTKWEAVVDQLDLVDGNREEETQSVE